MTVRPILRHPDTRLRAIAAPVNAFDDALKALAEEMVATMYAAPGRGLAAPQIGVMQRVFVMDADWKNSGVRAPCMMVNPRIAAASNRFQTLDEGCLSIPGVVVPVRRPAEVTLRWQDLHGEWHEQRFDGFSAACVQHERDHLDGVLCIDHLDDAERHAAMDGYRE